MRKMILAAARENRRVNPVLVLVATVGFFVAKVSGYTYQITGLGTLGGAWSHAYAINNSGQVVGASATAGNLEHAFFYSNGKMEDLGGGVASAAYGINSSGEITGFYYTGSNQCDAYVYSSGSMTDIGKLAGGGGGDSEYTSSLYAGCAISDAGEVVGTFVNRAGATHAFIYTAGPLRDLGTFDPNDPQNVNLGDLSLAFGINNSGQVVGYSNDGNNSANQAFLYSNGTMLNLGAMVHATSSAAYGINNAGQVVGWIYTGGEFQAFLYSGGNMEPLGTLGDAWAINDAGQILGGSNYDNFLYSDGAFINLNQLTASSGWDIRNAWAINDSGEIVGQGTNPEGQDEAFLLTVVPEPATASLLLIGGAGLLIRRRREQLA